MNMEILQSKILVNSLVFDECSFSVYRNQGLETNSLSALTFSSWTETICAEIQDITSA